MTAKKTTSGLKFSDRLGGWMVRWGIRRRSYRVEPGLYSIGSPGDRSPVLVTANYKLTFDKVRSELDGVDAWILVLDTKGVNVWCAAGKGTFGTKELVNRIAAVDLKNVVSHRDIILPQLGATGVAAHKVRVHSKFRVRYGPVRAADIRGYLEAGMRATLEMRRVDFNFADRIVLVPVELVRVLKVIVPVVLLDILLAAFGLYHLSALEMSHYIGAALIGCAVVPALLPWIPGRAFALKGWLAGLLWSAAWIPAVSWSSSVAHFLILPPIAAFLAMNFTGSSTYTSLSGVKKEMSVAIPAMIASAGIGILFLAAKIVFRF